MFAFVLTVGMALSLAQAGAGREEAASVPVGSAEPSAPAEDTVAEASVAEATGEAADASSPSPSDGAEDDALAQAMREAAAAFGDGDSSDDGSAPVSAVKSTTEVNGYVMNRTTFSWIDLGSPVASTDLPQLQNLLEGNVQLRRPLWTNAFLGLDASAFLQQGGWFVERGPGGERRVAADRDVLSLRPSFVASELYLSYSPHPNVNLMLGKRRVVWGPGLANNPTDLFNPARDPSDPNLQRAGAVLFKMDIPTEYVTFSFAASPQVLYSEAGLPYQFLKYPSYPQRNTVLERATYGDNLRSPLFPDVRDNELHYLLAARVYALIMDSDVNLIYYYSNLYADSFRNKSRVGLTFSRYFFTTWELHFELLLTEGTQRSYVNADCVSGLEAAAGCAASGAPLFGQFKLNDGNIYPRLLVGTRHNFSDESSISAEYLYVGDGYSPTEFQSFVRGITLAQQQGFSVAQATSGGNQGGIITRFSFDPLRRHYLFLTYTKPKIADDWSVNAVVVAGLEDLSLLVIPSVTWNALEWLNLQLGGFVPVRGIPVGQAEAFGRRYNEYSFFPYDFRVFFEARAFY